MNPYFREILIKLINLSFQLLAQKTQASGNIKFLETSLTIYDHTPLPVQIAFRDSASYRTGGKIIFLMGTLSHRYQRNWRVSRSQNNLWWMLPLIHKFLVSDCIYFILRYIKFYKSHPPRIQCCSPPSHSKDICCSCMWKLWNTTYS